MALVSLTIAPWSFTTSFHIGPEGDQIAERPFPALTPQSLLQAL